MELSSVYSHPCMYVLWLYGLSEGSGTCGNCQFGGLPYMRLGLRRFNSKCTVASGLTGYLVLP